MKTLSLLLSLWIMLAGCTKMTGFQPSPTQITDSLPPLPLNDRKLQAYHYELVRYYGTVASEGSRYYYEAQGRLSSRVDDWFPPPPGPLITYPDSILYYRKSPDGGSESFQPGTV